MGALHVLGQKMIASGMLRKVEASLLTTLCYLHHQQQGARREDSEGGQATYARRILLSTLDISVDVQEGRFLRDIGAAMSSLEVRDRLAGEVNHFCTHPPLCLCLQTFEKSLIETVGGEKLSASRVERVRDIAVGQFYVRTGFEVVMWFRAGHH